MASPENFLNQYFVKFAWGWTFSAVLLVVVLSHFLQSSSWLSVSCLASLVRLGVGTAVWGLIARVMFPYIEHITGSCPNTLFLTKRDCYQAGHQWTGFDASGHCFLLSWNNLFMVEEFTASCQKSITSPAVRRWPSVSRYFQILCCFLCLLMFLGEIMMVFTSLYFHSFGEKLAGTLCGLGTWYILYKILYPKVFYPNLKD